MLVGEYAAYGIGLAGTTLGAILIDGICDDLFASPVSCLGKKIYPITTYSLSVFLQNREGKTEVFETHLEGLDKEKFKHSNILLKTCFFIIPIATAVFIFYTKWKVDRLLCQRIFLTNPGFMTNIGYFALIGFSISKINETLETIYYRKEYVEKLQRL